MGLKYILPPVTTKNLSSLTRTLIFCGPLKDLLCEEKRAFKAQRSFSFAYFTNSFLFFYYLKDSFVNPIMCFEVVSMNDQSFTSGNRPFSEKRI